MMVFRLTIRNLFTALLLCLLLAVPVSLAVAEGEDWPEGTNEEDLFDTFDDLEEEFATNVVVDVCDPLEPGNRVVYVFNDRLYFWVMKPVAQGYEWLLPECARVSVRRFFSNLGFPGRFVNSLLQGKLRRSGVETARFGVNTTIGVAGLFDVADCWLDMEPPPVEDFGQTLGRYGLGGGYPLTLPILGPSNLRDTVGVVADGFLNPVAYVDPFWVYYASRTVEEVNEASLSIGKYESVRELALDPYTFMRDAYRQYRIKQVGE